MPYNVDSPNQLLYPFDFENPNRWLAKEVIPIESKAMRDVLLRVAADMDDFICWPDRSLLLWQGCDRVPEEGEDQKYHRFPEAIKKLAKQHRITLDGRANGPAKAAFLLAGGQRPERYGSTHSWTIHHLYSGKFPYVDRDRTLHAVKDCNHFTQSAGLIAAHPIADALVDDSPCFAWLLRAKAFKKFGYDPDGVFSPTRDKYGFTDGHTCEVILAADAVGAGQ